VALLSTALHAQTIYVKADATGANNGTSWSDAFTSVQSALAVPGTQIWIAAGTYTPGNARDSTFLVNGKSLYGGFGGTETLLSERDLASHRTVLSGEIGAPGAADNCGNVVTIIGGTVTLDGLTVTGGNPAGANSIANYAGGILHIASGPLTVANCRIVGNHGGGIMANGPATIVNTVFTGNISDIGSGLETFHGGSVINCTFAGNYDSFGSGPLYVPNGPLPTIRNTIIWANVAQSGIYPDSLTATNSIIEQRTNTDPMFADIGGGDFHLLPGSPAIDAGTAAVGTVDADGAPRVAGAAVDIGAFESSSNRLTVTRTGSGTGTVVSSPASINCGFTCAATLTPGDTYQLTAAPDPGFRFLGWEGTCSGAGACSVQVPANVSAHFGHVWFVKAAASGANDGTSWTDAFTDLQSALATAAPGDEIWAAAATYKPAAADTTVSFEMRSGIAIYGGFAGTETNRDQRNTAANVTTLSGDIGTIGDAADNSQSVVRAVQVDSGALLDGFTITGGHGGTSSRGGGVYFRITYARVAHCIITGNSGQLGGGFAVNYSGGTISDSVIANNAASNTGGGGYIESAPSFALVNSTLVNNTGYGGALSFTGSSGSPIVDRCRIRQSTTYPTVYIETSAALMKNCEIVGTDNNYPVIRSQGYATILNCTIIDPNSPLQGVFYIVFGWPTNVINSIIWGSEVPENNFANQGTGTYSNNLTMTDPMFVTGDPVNGNYRPGVGSPAVDGGNNTLAIGNVLDLDGKPRRVDDPQTADTGTGTAPIIDIGAYELHPVTVLVPASIGACTGSQVTMTAVPSGVGPFTYQWRKDTTPIGGATSATYTINSYSSATHAGLYDVIVTDVLGSSATSSQIDVHDAATTTNISGFTPTNGAHGTSVTIDGGGFDALIDVKFNGVSATISNHTATQIVAVVPLAATTGPITVTTSGCQATSSGSFTTPPFGPPMLTAVANSQTMISLTWTRAGGISGYEVKRLADPALGYETLTTTTSSSFTDMTPTAGHAYVYRVDALPAAPGAVASSPHDLVTTFTFTDAITQNATVITAAQWNDVRSAADAVYVLAGKGHIFPTPVASGANIMAQDVADVRTAVNAAFDDLQLSLITFADTLQQNVTPVRKQHIDEIRNALQ